MSALSLGMAWRNARINVLRNAIDGGAAVGRLKIFAGTRPAIGGLDGDLLANFAFADPCAPEAAAAVLTFSAIVDVLAVGTGEASWARAIDSAGNVVFDCDIATTGTPITIDTTTIITGGIVRVTSAVLNEGNS